MNNETAAIANNIANILGLPEGTTKFTLEVDFNAPLLKIDCQYIVDGTFKDHPKLPSMLENPQGLHERYKVTRVFGGTDPNAFYFVLRLDNHGTDKDHAIACREAAKAYIKTVFANNIQHLMRMSNDLNQALIKFESQDK